jgi:hypothetical protein
MRRDNNVQGTGEASYMRETERQYTELHARGNYEFYGVATGMATPMGGGGLPRRTGGPSLPGGGSGNPKALTPSTIAKGGRVFGNEIPIMDTSAVKSKLGKQAGDTSWAYSIHDHHFYPKWLGGKEGGSLLRVRGYEHLTDLEPALFEHMKRTIPGLSEKSSAQIQGLLRRVITQDDITRSLVDFYAGMYPQLGRQQIVDALKGGL